ncbi:MAG: hypothetical protein IKA03_04560, partial [Alphaproteobacteria bacterium]|nr:hypothetical protein [Alphaproteobacteria bacterium]
MVNMICNNNNFFAHVQKHCKTNHYNLFLHKHLGDVFYAIGLKDAFEKTHKAPLHFIIRPQHEFLMKMYNITNYSVCDIHDLDKKIMSLNLPYLPGSTNKSHKFDSLCKDLFVSFPIKAIPFILDGDINSFFLFNNYWCFLWAYNCGINIDNFKFNIPPKQLMLSKKALNKIKKIAPLNKIVLFAPEAATAIELPVEFWNEIAEEVHKKGYSIIVNSKKYKISHGISAFDLNLSLEDVVALGFNCANVFSLRSGLCDVLVGAGKKLYAFYPAMLRREMFSLSKPFSQPSEVKEIGIYNWKIDSVKWQGIDLTQKLQKQINIVYRIYLKEKIKALFSLRKRKERHKYLYNLFRNIGGISKMFPENNLGNPRPKQNVNLKFLGIPLWQKKYIKEGDGQKKVIKILGGLIKYTQSANNAKKLNILGIGVMTHKFVRFETIKILGVTVFKKDRQPQFLQWFLEQC